MVKPEKEAASYKTTSFRADSSLTEEAREVFAAQGLSVSAAITLFLEACVKQKHVPEVVVNPEAVDDGLSSADSILRSTAAKLNLPDFGDPKIPSKKFADDVVRVLGKAIRENHKEACLDTGRNVLELSFWGRGRMADEAEALCGSLEAFVPEKVPYDCAKHVVQRTTEAWASADQDPSALVKEPNNVIMGRILKRSRLTLEALMHMLVKADVVDGPDGDDFNRATGKMIEGIVARLKETGHWKAPKPRHGVTLGEVDAKLIDQVVRYCVDLQTKADYSEILALDHPICDLFENVAHEMNGLVEDNYLELFEGDDEAQDALCMDVFGRCEFRYPPKAVYDFCADAYLKAMRYAEPGTVAAKCLPFAEAPLDFNEAYVYPLAIDMDVNLWLDLYNRDAFCRVCEAIEDGRITEPEHRTHVDAAEVDDGLPEGMHRGCLAGLSEEERKAALERHDRDTSGSRLSSLNVLKERAIEFEPTSFLSGVLCLGRESELFELCEAYGIELEEGEMTSHAFEALSDALTAGDGRLAADLGSRHVFFRESLRRALDAGGRIEFPADDPDAVREYQGTNQCWPYANLFLMDGVFTFQVPDELLPVLLAFDWSDIDARHKAWEDALHCAEVCADFYGIVPVEFAYHQFRAWYDHDISEVEFYGYILRDRVMGGSEFYLVELGDPFGMTCTHLASYKLMDPILGLDTFVVGDEIVSREEYLYYLMGRQFAISRCPIPDELRDKDPFKWKMGLPATVRFRNYLDAHVPDGDNDYYYAERMIEGLLFADGPLFENIDEEAYIEMLGLAYSDEAFNEAYGLWSGMMAALPCWESHGWSYIDFLKKREEWLDDEDDFWM